MITCFIRNHENTKYNLIMHEIFSFYVVVVIYENGWIWDEAMGDSETLI